MSKVTDFYDEFTERQLRSGINHRHLSIQRNLELRGLKKSSSILEIGCGIGTVSELVLRFLGKEGSLIATDISPKSLEIAKARLSKYSNVKISQIDFTEKCLEDSFDIVLLPDVIEHIPIELHPKLFSNISNMLNENGMVFIHIPDPNHLEWVIKNDPKELQVIDQPIHTHLLANNIEGTGLYIHYLESYSVYNVESDYQIIILKKQPKVGAYSSRDHFLNDSFFRKTKRKLRYYLRGGK